MENNEYNYMPRCDEDLRKYQSDWDEDNEALPSFIKNKPDLSCLDEIPDMITDINNLKTQVSNLDDDIHDILIDLGDVKTRVSAVETSIGTLNSSLLNYASKTYVDNKIKDFITADALKNYYTKTQIDAKGYLTASSLSNYYTKTQVDDLIGNSISDSDLDDIWNVLGDDSGYTSIGITLIDDLKFRYGVNTVSTLAALPVTKQSVVASLDKTSDTLSLSGNLKPGQYINIQVKSKQACTITFPTASSSWVHMGITSNTFAVAANSVHEINIWCTGTNTYSIKVL